jgi:hypothetical protein
MHQKIHKIKKFSCLLLNKIFVSENVNLETVITEARVEFELLIGLNSVDFKGEIKWLKKQERKQ